MGQYLHEIYTPTERRGDRCEGRAPLKTKVVLIKPLEKRYREPRGRAEKEPWICRERNTSMVCLP